MKKTILYILTSLIGFTPAFAQKDAKAKAILADVSTKYKSYATVSTDFTFLLDDPQGGGKQTRTGNLLSNTKANRYKVTLFEPGGKAAVEQEIISDGKTQWTYLKRDKEVQVNNAGKADDEMNPSQLFTLYEHGYKYIYTGDQKINGKAYAAIELSPEASDKNIFKIKLLIDKAKKQLYSATLFDKGGSRYTYTLTSFIPNPKISGDTFTYDKKAHPGVEYNDLRM